MGMMITASKAVFTGDTPTTGILHGVVGYDITLQYLMGFLEQDQQFDENFYPFLINYKDGSMLYHPKMAST